MKTTYTNTHYGNIVRVDGKTGDARAIHPYPVNLRGSAATEHPYRFNWNSPIHMSPHDPKTIYFGSNVLFKTNNGGQSWEKISVDLTTNDPEKLQVSGGPITPDNTSAEYHSAIITISESPITAGLIWVGTDDGKVWITRNGGTDWEDVTGNVTDQSPACWVSRVEASRAEPGTAYLAVDRHRSNDPSPFVFKTTDFGRSWRNIPGNLPPLKYVHVVREDPRNPNLVYVGTEMGVYASFSGGDKWVSLRLNLPPVAVRDILIHPRDNDLIIGTHGRSIWILDDLAVMQQLGPATDQEAFLFEPRLATRWVIWNRNHAGYPGQRWLGDQTFYGENPPFGAIINYYLKGETKPEESRVTLKILDSDLKEVRILDGPARAGVNRITWDLRHEALVEPEGAAKVGFNPSSSPLVLPGRYTVQLEIGEQVLERPLEVRLDPRVEFSETDLRAQYQAVRRLTDMEMRAIEALRTVESSTLSLEGVSGKLCKIEELPEDTTAGLTDEIEELTKDLAAVKSALVRATPGLGYRSSAELLEKIRQLRSGSGNFPGIEGANAPPTREQADWLERLDEELKEVEQRLDSLISERLKALNRKLNERGIPHIMIGQ